MLGMSGGEGHNEIRISGRLVERLLLSALLLIVGGSTVIGGVERGELQTDVEQVCGQVQNVRDELALLFEPFLDLPDDGPDPAGRRALQRVIDRLRAEHRCP